MDGILPDEVRNRKSKADFTPFVNRELRQRADQLDRLLESSLLANWGVIDIAQFRQLFRRFCETEVSHEERLACRNVIGLELWYQKAMSPAQVERNPIQVNAPRKESRGAGKDD
jgi:hypothetical protein